VIDAARTGRASGTSMLLSLLEMALVTLGASDDQQDRCTVRHALTATCSNGGGHFFSTLADIRRTMFTIEPLSQSDRASSQLLLFRLTGTHSRVSLFARPDISSGERKYHEHQAGMFRSADYGNLSELQKRDDNNGSHADLPRRRL
jgi:hypothetical protein